MQWGHVWSSLPEAFFLWKTQIRPDRGGLTVYGLILHKTLSYLGWERGPGGEIYHVITIHYSTITDTQTKLWTQKSYGLSKKHDKANLERCTLRQVFLLNDVVLDVGKGLDCKEHCFYYFNNSLKVRTESEMRCNRQ